MLISDGLFPYIDDFKALPKPEFSDQCKIVLTIKNLKPIKTKQNNYKWSTTVTNIIKTKQNNYKWSTTVTNITKTKQNNYKWSTTVTNTIKHCKQRIEAGLIESSGKMIQKIIHEAADLSLKEVTNYLSKRRFKKSQKKWFDKDCIKFKYLASKTAILKHRNPWNNNLRVSHRTRLKEFKNICRIKKNQFWQNEMIKLENVNNVENFWKNWKQMGEDLINHNSLPENVDGQR